MSKCSVCGTTPALCADKYDKGTYFLCSGCLSEKTIENANIMQALDDMAEDCPDCNNLGYIEGIYNGIATACCNRLLESGERCGNSVQKQAGDPYQEPCEFCLTVKTSRFNIDLLKIQAITGKERDEAEKILHQNHN
jgi:hypothetical protein